MFIPHYPYIKPGIFGTVDRLWDISPLSSRCWSHWNKWLSSSPCLGTWDCGKWPHLVCLGSLEPGALAALHSGLQSDDMLFLMAHLCKAVLSSGAVKKPQALYKRQYGTRKESWWYPFWSHGLRSCVIPNRHTHPVSDHDYIWMKIFSFNFCLSFFFLKQPIC